MCTGKLSTTGNTPSQSPLHTSPPKDAVLQIIGYNFLIAVESIAQNKTQALLTSLGIIFGVASVIAMLAIGKGAQQEILAQIRLLGANNVIVTPLVEQKEGAVDDEASSSGSAGEEKQPYSPGLTLADAASIASVIPNVDAVSAEVVVETQAIRAGLRRSAKLVGIDGAYLDVSGGHVAQGSTFTARHLTDAVPVCLIGADVRTRFFPGEEPIGRRIKAGGQWFTVIGVMERRNVDAQHIEHLGLRDYDLDVYVPLQALLLRVEDRARLTTQDIREAQRRNNGQGEAANYHQIDRLTVRVTQSERVRPVAGVISRMLERRHKGVVDYQVTVPETLLQQERRTQRIFNVVLAAIASISLLVGGIGIMNIMLASVMERIREIGVRRSMGATRHDIVLQFLIEAVTISFTGGLLGVLLGGATSLIIEQSTGIVTVVSLWSVLLSFVVAVSVGLVFGLWPAKRAAEQDPITALRHE